MIIKIFSVLYDVIVELMNIHEIKCRNSNQAIFETCDDNLARFSAVNQTQNSLLVKRQTDNSTPGYLSSKSISYLQNQNL